MLNSTINFTPLDKPKNSIEYANNWGINEGEAEKIIPHLNSPIIHDRYYYDDGNDSGYSHLINFFRLSQLSQLKSQKDVFIKNMEDSRFTGLLFLPSIYSICSLGDKAKLLLKWGYNPNIQLKDTPYSHLITQVGPEATPVHTFDKTSDLKNFIEHGADTHRKTIYYPFMKAFYDATKIKKITLNKHLRELIDFCKYYPVPKDELGNISYIEQFFNLTHLNSPHKSHAVDIYNAQLLLCQKPLTPYEFAKLEGKKSKILFLKQFESNEALLSEERKAYEAIVAQTNLKEKQKLLEMALKSDNNVLFDNLAQLNLIHHFSGYTLLHKAINYNNKRFIEKIVNEKLVDISSCGYLKYSYNQKKTASFLYFYHLQKNEAKFKEVVESIVSDISFNMQRLKKFATDKDIMSQLPTTIVYFLSQQGYYFENSLVIEKIAQMEKEKLTLILQINPAEPEKKSFKI